jgi:hypothetical protein
MKQKSVTGIRIHAAVDTAMLDVQKITEYEGSGPIVMVRIDNTDSLIGVLEESVRRFKKGRAVWVCYPR